MPTSPEAEPRTTPVRWGLWGTALWTLALLLLFALVQVLAAAGYAAWRYDPEAGLAYRYYFQAYRLHGTSISLSILATLLVCGASLLLIIRGKRGAVLRDYLPWTLPAAVQWRRWFAVMIVFMVMTELVARFYPPANEHALDFMVTAYASARPVWLLWLAAVIAAPLLEEMLFRGFLFAGIEASRFGAMAAVLVSATVWAATHLQYDLYHMSIILVMGLIFGLARWQSGSLLLPLALHVFNNAAAMLQTMTQAGQA